MASPPFTNGILADWRVRDILPPAGSGVLYEPNQQPFQSILDSFSRFTDRGDIALQHDIYIEAVNLAIGYTLPYLQYHSPAFDIKPFMKCYGGPVGEMYKGTNWNLDGPWYGTGDVATRSSIVGISRGMSASGTYVSTGTSTTTRKSGGGNG